MRKLVTAALFALPMFAAPAMTQDTLKIGWIDPLSGGGASVGERGLKTFQFLADELNAKGGILGKQVEIVPFDNKVNPQESLIQAQKAIDAGIRILTQGNGSSVAGALTDFVTKYNERNLVRRSCTSTMRRSIRCSRTTSAASGISAGTRIPI